MTATTLTVKYKFFRRVLATWDDMFAEAAEFAAGIGRERLIGISQSADKSEGVVTVWYWDEPVEDVTIGDPDVRPSAHVSPA